MKSILIGVVCLLTVFSARSQDVLVLAWDFNGNAGNEISVAAVLNNANLQQSSIVRGPGLTAATLSNAFNSTGWTTTNSLQDAISGNDFLQFTIQSRSSYIVSLSQLETVFRRSGTGPDHFQWMASVDGATYSPIGSEIVYTGTTTNGSLQPAIDLRSYPTLQNVSSSGTIHFRLYGYNSASSGGSFAVGRLSGNDIALTGSVQAVAPVILKSFSSSSVNKQIQLRWSSLSEAHHEYYVIERSEDGKVFREIGKVNSVNHHDGHNYEFADKQPLNGLNYYRLKMVDANLYYEYGPVTMCRFQNTETAPMIKQLDETLWITLPTDEGVVCLIDLYGRTHIKKEIKGNAALSLNISFLPRGNYVLVVKSRKGNFSQVIQRR